MPLARDPSYYVTRPGSSEPMHTFPTGVKVLLVLKDVFEMYELCSFRLDSNQEFLTQRGGYRERGKFTPIKLPLIPL